MNQITTTREGPTKKVGTWPFKKRLCNGCAYMSRAAGFYWEVVSCQKAKDIIRTNQISITKIKPNVKTPIWCPFLQEE